MKQKLSSLIILLIITFSGYGQSNVPVNPNDISPLLIGEELPHLQLKDIKGQPVNLKSLYQSKPVVLIVYRGGWCPYCNVHMAQLRDIEADIIKAGYDIVAISPDSPENLKVSAGKNNLNYSLYSDADMKLSQTLGIAYEAPKRNLALLESSSGGQNPGMLPVPSVFVVNTEGVIAFEYINPNYKVRITSEMLLAAVNSL